MYKLTTKTGKVFTIPKENIGLLAFTQAQDRGLTINPRDKDMAIAFLRGIGIEVSENG
jgi:hypothetical protein